MFELVLQNTLNGIESSRLFLYSKTFFMPLFIDTMRFVHKSCSRYFTNHPTDDQLQQAADSSQMVFIKIIEETNENLKTVLKNPSKMNHRDLFVNLSLLVEVSTIFEYIVTVREIDYLIPK